jgi:hypothetical protein
VLCSVWAKYWQWLPDDGFFVNRNMLEQFHLIFFFNILVTTFFLTLCASVGQQSGGCFDAVYNFCLKHFSKKNLARYHKCTYRSPCHVAIILVKLQSNLNFLNGFSGDIKFHENPFSGSRNVQCARMDMTKLSVAFRYSANAPKNITYFHCYKSWCLSSYGTIQTRYPFHHTHSQNLRSETSTTFHHHYTGFVDIPRRYAAEHTTDRMLNTVPQTAPAKFSLRITH